MSGRRPAQGDPAAPPPAPRRPPAPGNRRPAYLYVAYPLSLTLGAANAVQTLATVRHLREEAAGQGAEVTLVVPRWLREPSRFGEVLGPGVRHLPRIPINKLTRFWQAPILSYLERTAWSAQLLGWILWRRLTGRRFAAIYARDVVCAYWLARARALTGAPLVYEVHEWAPAGPARPARWRAALDRAAIRRPDRLVSLTATFRDYLAAGGLRDPAGVEVIPDAFDSRLYGGTPQAAARAARDLPPAAFVVGYAGLTFAHRRLDVLLDAFAILATRVGTARPLRLVLAGGRPAEIGALRAQAAQLHIPVIEPPQSGNAPAAAGMASAESGPPPAGRPQVGLVLPGPVDQPTVVQYLYAADVLCIPDTVTTLTASPLKLFEYMAAGRPIVLRELPALREILGEAGYYVPPGDAPALAAALERIYHDPAEAAARGAVGAARATPYTYRERARRLLAVLAHTAAARTPGSSPPGNMI